MTQTGASSPRPRLLAVISPGDGPHLVAPTVAETHTALTLLRAIAGPRGVEAARTLRYMCLVHGQTETADMLERWIAQQEAGHS